ncbi:MAG TPA: hypothetical protein VJO34_13005, partial [Methylomirabilota bacterium]|nr:hypothetical protein [Methylomirabilota bacterium]
HRLPEALVAGARQRHRGADQQALEQNNPHSRTPTIWPIQVKKLLRPWPDVSKKRKEGAARSARVLGNA